MAISEKIRSTEVPDPASLSPAQKQGDDVTNHLKDCLNYLLDEFNNGGYYNYASHLYNAGQTTGIVEPKAVNGQCSMFNDAWFTIDGRRLAGKPTQKGVYIHKGKKQVVD